MDESDVLALEAEQTRSLSRACAGGAAASNAPRRRSIGLRIARDGSWLYRGSPIRRPQLVRLFASILRRESDCYALVTPIETIEVEVEDAPFLAVELLTIGTGRTQILRVRTNVGDVVDIGEGHALRFASDAADGVKPYVEVRDGLWALFTRALAYDVVAGAAGDAASEGFGVWSNGRFFAIDCSGGLQR